MWYLQGEWWYKEVGDPQLVGEMPKFMDPKYEKTKKTECWCKINLYESALEDF